MTDNSEISPSRCLHADDRCRYTIYQGETPPRVWRSLLSESATHAFSHLDFWTQSIVRHLPRQRGCWLVAERSGSADGGIALVEYRRGPFRRYSAHFMGTPGFPLINDTLDAEARDNLIRGFSAGLLKLSRSPWVIDLNLFLPADVSPTWARELDAAGAVGHDVPASVIPLAGGIEAVESGHFHRTRRKERNRALRAGCEPLITSDPGIIREYYPVYTAAARRWGIDPLPAPFFESLLATGGGRAFISGVRYQGQLIGAHLNLQGEREITAWNGATLSEHNDKYPATLLIWTDIEEACRRGADTLDLGSHGGLAGVQNFKTLFGAEDRIRRHVVMAPRSGRLLRGMAARLRRRSR